MAETPPLLPAALPKPLSTFVGRRSELEELKRVLVEARLVTLVGPGGCGKTRLAIEVAAETAHRFPDGIAFADLAPVQDPAMVTDAVAASIRPLRQGSEGPADLICSGRWLLLLDNAEHLVEAVSSQVTQLLATCPSLAVLVTSREHLDIGGEVSWRVPPLRLPPEGAALGPSELAGYDAVDLFVTRTTEHGGEFRLTPANAPLVLAICRRLGGIPLALELAAARVRSLGLVEIVARLNDSFRLLTGGSRTAVDRHRTLRATVEWSYRLLDETERRLLRRLALFAGTFDLRAVEQVCSGLDQPVEGVADVLHRLVDKSLVTAHSRPDGRLRYSLMEPIHQYELERLVEAGESSLRGRHARYYAGLAAHLDGEQGDLGNRVERMTAEHDNVRRALDWAADEDPAMEAALVLHLRWFWLVRGSVREACQATLSALAKDHPSPARRARLHAMAASWFRQAGDPAMAVAHGDESVRLLDEIDDAALSVQVLWTRGIQRALEGDLAGAEQDFLRAVALLKDEPQGEGRVLGLNNLAMIRLVAGRPREALEDVERVRKELTLMHDKPVGFTNFLHTQGAVLLAVGRVVEARECFLAGLDHAAEYDNYAAAVALLQGLACAASVDGRAAACLTLLGAARNCSRVAGVEPIYAPGTPTADAERVSRVALGELSAEQAWSTGARMDLKAALEYARAAGHAAPVGRLTARKREIVRLVALGLTNKEIARRLSVSLRTVDAHLEQIRNQLGLHNRAQVAAWATSEGLLSDH